MSISRVAAEINMKNNNLCRYYAATEDDIVVNWYSFIVGEVELKCTTKADAELLITICRLFGIQNYDVNPDEYESLPFWYIKDQELHATLFTLESDAVGAAYKVKEYIEEYAMGKLISVSRERWDSIGSDYKGEWLDYYDECPEWKGRKVVMSGCITEDPAELGKLLIEGVHFRITGKETRNA